MKTKTQKIKRSDLKILYDKVCESWQREIEKLILWSDSNIIEVFNDLIIKAYKEADVDQKKLLEKYFDIEELFDYTKIKSLEDVYKLLKIKESDFYDI